MYYSIDRLVAVGQWKGGDTSCRNEEMSNYFLALSLCCKVVVIIMFVLSLVLYKPPPAKDNVVVVTSDNAKSGVRNPSFKELEHDADNERKNGHTAAVGT